MEKKQTVAFKEGLQRAKKIAHEHHNYQLDIPHLWAALMQPEYFAYSIYEDLGLDMNALTQCIQAEIEKISTLTGTDVTYGEKQSQRLRNLFSKVEEMAQSMQDDYVTVEHVVLALFDQPFNPITDFLLKNDINYETVQQKINQKRQGKQVTSVYQESLYESLNTYAVNLNQRYRNGKMGKVIGRDPEIKDVIRVLTRKQKNNAILIGHSGVGKTAIVEGLVQKIERDEVPKNLKDKIVFNLDMSALVAGAKYRGEFEEKLRAVLQEVHDSNHQVILLIDEIHTIVGIGQAEGSMDAGNILKPMLARGELHCIGLTTPDEYRESIEKDKALERRFQRVSVHEPSIDDTITILHGIKQSYERFHMTKITNEAIEAAVKMSSRYITDRFLPDKAIDLLDEACAVKHIQLNEVPTEIHKLGQEILNKSIAIYKQKKSEGTENSNDFETIDALKEKQSRMKQQWQHELNLLSETQHHVNRLDNLRTNYQQALESENIPEIIRLQEESIPYEKEKIESLNTQRYRHVIEEPFLNEVVTAEDIANVVERLTGIKVSGILENERRKLLNLEEELNQLVVGQQNAVEKVSQSVLRSRAGIQNPTKPTGTFLFLGPTGVGKTQLAKSLAYVLFGTELDAIRLDMSEYMEKHAVSRLVGPPPGYVGYDEGGQLTEAVRHKLHSIVVLDEIEKAHPDVFNLLLQVLDEGRLTDSQGRTVDFKNTILIMTSNVGSSLLLEAMEDHKTVTNTARNQVKNELHHYFKPEFLNRIDHTLIFNPLNAEHMYAISERMIQDLNRRLEDKKMGLSVDQEVIKWIAENGYDVINGARPLQRFITERIETPIAREMIKKDEKENLHINISMEQGNPVFNYERI
ncbi:ATP-dependent Clp protease ATP-binding subunit ClpB [Lentibacillus persicus]|uniref:ATP-dependent Clp protease ATP-binding subunit ClpB n=1 Tax=Lentibacillus persicus TaxID=640948 RepID=A0A1I1S8A7_9BACI|nr:AAA family ATPase [Lentibacillus persicus]SFD42696.1 ATP-dependent Clp protease ATP-binding subunit ClpB [Lentibacillus persicus]